jgi:hypothetical protein
MALAVLGDVFLLHSVDINSLVHPVLYSVGAWEVFPQGQSDWVVTADLRVAESVAVTSTPCISWLGVYLNKDSFMFYPLLLLFSETF